MLLRAPLRQSALAVTLVLAYTVGMIYRFLADLVLVLHLAFVAFALFGGVLVMRWPKVLPWHLAALSWGVMVQAADWICPLTYVENQFRYWGGQAGYAGSFVEEWISPVLYPSMLTLELRYLLALVLLVVNLAVYATVLVQRRKRALLLNKPVPLQSNLVG